MDMKRLIQFMGMTFSKGDGEALNALRMANRMLEAEGKSWSDILSPPKPPPVGMSSPRSEYRTPPSKRKAGAAKYGRAAPQQRYDPDIGRNVGDDIQEMLTDLSGRRMDMSTMMFVAGLNNDWEKKDYLTDPQYEALKRIHGGRAL